MNLIAAADENWGIGKNGGLWGEKHWKAFRGESH